MRKSLYLFFLVIAAGLASCRKERVQQTIKQYDDSQIQAYIASKGYAHMQRDTVGGDTTGIYYEILNKGTGPLVDYSTAISYVYTVQSIDGGYSLTDTIANHTYLDLGNVSPSGLQLGLHDVLLRQGTSLRIIIPSHLAYGNAGTGAGSNRINGNQALDYYINVVNNVTSLNGVTYANNINTYDDISIQKYMSANSIGGFTKITTGPYAGMYYKIRTTGTGPININTTNSIVSFDYRAQLLNGTVAIPSDYSTTTGVVAATNSYYMALGTKTGQLPGLYEALLLGQSAGAQLTIIVPSYLANGFPTISGSFPAFSCVFYDVTIDSVTN